MADTPPAHISDVQQPVDPSKIDKRSEIGNIFDGSISKIAYLERFQQLLFHLLTSFFDESTTGDDDVASLLVDLENHALDILTDVVTDILRTPHIDLAGRQEHVHSYVNQQTSLDLAFNRPLYNVAFRMTGDDIFPLTNAACFSPRQQNKAYGILKFFQ